MKNQFLCLIGLSVLAVAGLFIPGRVFAADDMESVGRYDSVVAPDLGKFLETCDSAFKDKLKSLKIGVGSFRHLYAASGEASGSGIDYCAEVMAGIKETGFLKEVRLANDISKDINYLISLEFNYDGAFLETQVLIENRHGPSYFGFVPWVEKNPIEASTLAMIKSSDNPDYGMAALVEVELPPVYFIGTPPNKARDQSGFARIAGKFIAWKILAIEAGQAFNISGRRLKYPNLEAASNGSGLPAGAKLLIPKGNYRNNAMSVTRPMEIIGQGAADEVVLEHNRYSHNIWVSSPFVRIRNLTIKNTSGIEGYGKDAKGWYPVWVNSGRAVIEDCELLSKSLAVIKVSGEQTTAVIRRCKLEQASTHNSAVVISDGATGVIEDCQITSAQATDSGYPAVTVTRKGAAEMRRCKIYQNASYGVWLTEKSRALIEQCEITASKIGVCIESEALGRINNCQVKDNREKDIDVRNTGEAIIDGVKSPQ